MSRLLFSQGRICLILLLICTFWLWQLRGLTSLLFGCSHFSISSLQRIEDFITHVFRQHRKNTRIDIISQQERVRIAKRLFLLLNRFSLRFIFFLLLGCWLGLGSLRLLLLLLHLLVFSCSIFFLVVELES